MAHASIHQFDERWWNIAIYASTIVTVGIVFISLHFGQSVLFTHLFYIPIVLVSYRYPSKGIYFALSLGVVYLIADFILTSPSAFYLLVGAGRSAMFIILAWVVSTLSLTLLSGEERYRETIDSTKDAIFVVDRGLTPVLFNNSFHKWCHKIGVRIPLSPWKMPLFEILPFIPPSLQSQYGWVFVTGNPYHKEERFSFDGNEVVCEIQLTPVFKDDSGEVERVLTVMRDITDRKKAEEALRRSEDLYHTIFDTTGTATVILEEDDTISLANRECELLFGVTVEDLESGRTWVDLIAEEDRARLMAYRDKRNKNNDSPVPRTYEARCVDVSGILRDTIVTVGMIPGTTRRVVSILDITAKKQAERLILTANRISQMIVHEDDKRDLMHLACRELSGLDPHLLVSISFFEHGNLTPVAISDTGYRAFNEMQLHRSWVREAVEQKIVNMDVDLVNQSETGVEFIEHAFAIPMVIGAEVKGVVVTYLFPGAKVGEQEMESFQTLANDLGFAIKSMEIEEEKRVALMQIEKNMEQLAILNDSIRNPLQAIVGFADLQGDGLAEIIKPYVDEIDSLINKLDVGWVESEKIRAFLRKHYDISEEQLKNTPEYAR